MKMVCYKIMQKISQATLDKNCRCLLDSH